MGLCLETTYICFMCIGSFQVILYVQVFESSVNFAFHWVSRLQN